MFRLALLTTLAAVAVSYPLGLKGLLHQADISGALGLVQSRYHGISSNAATYIIRQAILKPSSAIFGKIKYKSVPSISLRLPYLKTLFQSYPSVFYGSYQGGLTSYLGNKGVRLSSSALVDPLALTDYYLGGNLIRPISSSLFNNFFSSRIFGLHHKTYNGIYTAPSIKLIGGRLSALSFNKFNSIFRPIGGIHISQPATYGLTGLLAYGDIAGALGLVQSRYQGISSTAAAYIIRQAILKPSSAIFGKIKYKSVPAISLRLPYLKTLFQSYPSVFYGSYQGGLASYLGNKGVRLSSSALVDPLALTDYYLGGNLIRPISSPLFNNFFSSRIFGLRHKTYNGIYTAPSIKLIGSRLSALSFNKFNSIFRPIGGIRISQPATYGLTGLLAYGDIAGALGLVQSRYQGISSTAAAYIIRQAILKPSSAIFGKIKYKSVPAISLRLPYLKTLFQSYPSVFYGSYQGGLASYLGSKGVRLSSSALVDPLALTDYYLGGNLIRPISSSLFNNFFSSRIFGLRHKTYNGIYTAPSIKLIGSRLSALSFNKFNSIFRPIGGIAPHYTGVGSGFWSVYSQLGLPYPLQPAVCLGGFNDYLSALSVGVPQFISYIKRAPIATLVKSVTIQQIQPIVQKLKIVSAPIIQKDILPLLAYRYYAYPKVLRRNVLLSGSLLPFNSIVANFFGSPLVLGGRTYSRQYISGLLGSFDQYIYTQLKGYKGKWWGGNLGGLYGKWYKGYKGYKGFTGHKGQKGYKGHKG